MHSRQDDTRAILDAFRRITRALREFAAGTERTSNISAAQLFALQTVARSGPLCVAELADLTLTHQSSVSVVVRKLVDARLLARRAATKDRRRSELVATARGRALLARAPAALQDRLIAAVLALDGARRRELAALLGDLAAKITDTDAPAPMFFEPPGAEGERVSGGPTEKPARTRARTR